MSKGGIQQQNRPSGRELHKKVDEALECLQSGKPGRRIIPEPKHLPMSWGFMGVCSAAEFWQKLEEILHELKELDPTKQYAGRRPPVRSYEAPPLKGKELWAYAWDSAVLGKMVYLKFAIAKRGNRARVPVDSIFLFVDCHENQHGKE